MMKRLAVITVDELRDPDKYKTVYYNYRVGWKNTEIIDDKTNASY